MAARSDQMTRFTYTTYIHAMPERVWQGLTDPDLKKRYWRHQRAGAKTFRSDWKKGSTYDLMHEEVGLVVSDPEQVILESDPYRRLAYTWHTFAPEWSAQVGWTKPPLKPGGLSPAPRSPTTSRTPGTVWSSSRSSTTPGHL
jgi:uncharacterized protein YndB with AHSA1/START domain